jgi:hypothetical protein
MESVQSAGALLGLGLLSGIRLYLTVFALGLIVRFQWFTLPFPAEHLQALASTPVLILSGLACALEFVADKIPWVDSLWDSIHTFVRPIGAALLGFAILDGSDPSTQVMLSLLAGGVAFTGHASKAGTRLTVNHSPEPFSNMLLSIGEDILVPFGIWFTLQNPILMLAIVIAFSALFVWLAPKLYRILRLEWTAFLALVRRWFGGGDATSITPPTLEGVSPEIARTVESILLPSSTALPEPYASELRSTPPAIHCAPARGLRPLQRSLGYICIQHDGLLFVTRRWFRTRTHLLPWHSMTGLAWQKGLLLDTLRIEARGRTIEFDVFKAPKARLAESVRFSPQAG